MKRFLALLVFALFVAVSSFALNQLFGVPFEVMQLVTAIGLVIMLISFLIYAKGIGVLKPKRMTSQEQQDRIKLLSELDQLQANDSPASGNKRERSRP
ncbi:hypothetical protein [Sulfurimicrobium lacus]|uniref:hypothetical protein n=1 Tax=Sulfurimicrobium lacus TaxID=2715678 RepID=UPI001566C19B|nr:hypothetical protein [Sulfurimicrobium lacus]